MIGLARHLKLKLNVRVPELAFFLGFAQLPILFRLKSVLKSDGRKRPNHQVNPSQNTALTKSRPMSFSKTHAGRGMWIPLPESLSGFQLNDLLLT